MSLRERKKARTRDRLVAEGIRLFVERGYDETSVEEIAAAADVSPRTFFRYFPSKADVVFVDLQPRLATLRAALETSRPVHDSVRDVIAGTVGLLASDPELLAARNRLVLETPSLRLRLLEFFAAAEAIVTDAYAHRSERAPTSLEPRLAAAVTVGAGRSAMLAWSMTGGDPDPLLDRAFAATASTVRRVLRGD